MKVQHVAPNTVHGLDNLGGWIAGVVAVLLIGFLIMSRLATPSTAPLTSVPLDQASVGQHTTVTGFVFDGTRYRNAPIMVGVGVGPALGLHTTVTGMVFDGTRYHSAPIAVGMPRSEQPVIGKAMTITGLAFDGTVYRNTAIAVGKARSGYTVTAMVDDGTGYHSVPVIVTSR